MIRRLADSPMMSNLLWLAVCLLLAIGVWYIVSWANISIDDRTFDNRPINFKESEMVALVSGSATMADLYLQGEETTLWRLTSSDIEIIANLLHLPPGSHTVALVVKLPDNLASPLRRVLQPAEITVDLESRETRSVAVAINIGKPPPIGFRQADPEAEIDTVLVSGAASQVAQVQAARGLLDLSTSRSPIAVDLPLQAIDAAGKRVADVSLSPQSVLVTVPISRRDDVKQVTVNPKILFETLPAGFSVKGISTVPQTLFISGAPELLAQIEDFLPTEEISLANPEKEFVKTVLVQLPTEELVILGRSKFITVSLEIEQDRDSRQFEDIEVGHFGLLEDYRVEIVPRTVSAIITGPVVLVEALSAADIQLNVDLTGLEPGIYDLPPTIFINQDETQEELTVDDVSLSPAVLTVEISSPEMLATQESETEAGG